MYHCVLTYKLTVVSTQINRPTIEIVILLIGFQ